MTNLRIAIPPFRSPISGWLPYWARIAWSPPISFCVEDTHSPNFRPGSGGVAFRHVLRAASLGLVVPFVALAKVVTHVLNASVPGLLLYGGR